MPRLLALLFVALLLAAACGNGNDDGATDDRSDNPSCSAADLFADPEEQPNLPGPVAIMRQQIINTATACNYDQLRELALEGDSQFTYSFGDDGPPDWRTAEERLARGERGAEEAHGPLELMVELLNRPYGVNDQGDEPLYVWPSAFAYDSWDDVPEEDREALNPLYDEDDFAAWDRFGGYIGHRIGITAAGDWIFFVAGD